MIIKYDIRIDVIDTHRCRLGSEMKTASLGLLEVMVVRVNAGGDAPPDPPLLVMSWAILLYFRF